MNRNKRIIGLATIVLVLTIFCLILLNSEAAGPIGFQRVKNGNTGEPLSILMSLFLYFLLWGVAGLVPSSAVFLFSLCVYFFLHRKDKRLFERKYFPKYEEEFQFGGAVAFSSTYLVVLILMLLQIMNLATIHIF